MAADFTADAGVSTVIAYDTANNGTDDFTGLAAGAQVIASGSGTGGSSTVNFAYAAPTGAVSVAVDGGVNGVMFNNGPTSAPTSAAIASTGAANGTSTGPDIFNLAAGATLTALTVNAASSLVAVLNPGNYAPTAALTVTGAATSVNLGATDFKTINASGLTSGGLTITAGANVTAFTGGAAANVLDLAAGVIGGTGLALNGGGGASNILGIADTSLSTADYTSINAATKFQPWRSMAWAQRLIRPISRTAPLQRCNSTPALPVRWPSPTRLQRSTIALSLQVASISPRR